MVNTIKPVGAICESLVTSISSKPDGYYAYDKGSNKFEISEFEFYRLKGLGKELRHDYIKRTRSN